MLELLIKHELTIKRLYETFAGIFERHSDFWQRLAADEQNHASWLEALRSRPAYGKWFLQQSQLKPQAIELSIKYVENQITRAEKQSLSYIEALSIAKDLENALMERQFARVDDSAPRELRSVLDDLARETGRHRDYLTETLNAQKRPG